MRKLRLMMGLLFCGGLNLGAQNDCSPWSDLTSGAELIYAWYDTDGEVTDYSKRRVKEVSSRGDGGTLVLIDLNAWSARGDTLFQISYLNQCKDGQVWAGLLGRLTPKMLSSLAHLELKIDGNALVLPQNLNITSVIPDSKASISALNEGQAILTIDLSFENIRVITSETLTTPAGNFDCNIIQYQTSATTISKKELLVKEWYAAGYGMIRREIFDAKRNLISYQQLISLKA